MGCTCSRDGDTAAGSPDFSRWAANSASVDMYRSAGGGGGSGAASYPHSPEAELQLRYEAQQRRRAATSARRSGDASIRTNDAAAKSSSSSANRRPLPAPASTTRCPATAAALGASPIPVSVSRPRQRNPLRSDAGTDDSEHRGRGGRTTPPTAKGPLRSATAGSCPIGAAQHTSPCRPSAFEACGTAKDDAGASWSGHVLVELPNTDPGLPTSVTGVFVDSTNADTTGSPAFWDRRSPGVSHVAEED